MRLSISQHSLESEDCVVLVPKPEQLFATISLLIAIVYPEIKSLSRPFTYGELIDSGKQFKIGLMSFNEDGNKIDSCQRLQSLEVWVIRKKKALFFTFWLYTLFLWLYIVARIVIDQVPLGSLFFDSVPFFTFTILGVIAFVLSMIFLYLFLAETSDLKVF